MANVELTFLQSIKIRLLPIFSSPGKYDSNQRQESTKHFFRVNKMSHARLQKSITDILPNKEDFSAVVTPIEKPTM